MKALRAALVALCLASWAAADDLRDLAQAFQRGAYEDVIQRTTALLEEQEQPDPACLFLRGIAAYRIAWFGQAEADLSQLLDYQQEARWPSAKAILERIARSREVAPAKVQEIGAGGKVLFRVYYDVDDKWTRALMASLRDIHPRVSAFYGVTMAETAVFVFADKERHAAFVETLTGEAPHGWAWASGANGMLIFTPYMPGDTYRVSASQLPETAAHEFSHCLIHRVLGTTAVPMWLDEGLAMYCGSLIRPDKNQENDIALTRMWTGEEILPLRAVTNRNTFYDERIAPYAYTQGFAMVRFLLATMGRDDLLVLLNSLKQEGHIEQAMRQMWQGGLEGFYEDWLAATEERVKKFQ